MKKETRTARVLVKVPFESVEFEDWHEIVDYYGNDREMALNHVSQFANADRRREVRNAIQEAVNAYLDKRH